MPRRKRTSEAGQPGSTLSSSEAGPVGPTIDVKLSEANLASELPVPNDVGLAGYDTAGYDAEYEKQLQAALDSGDMTQLPDAPAQSTRQQSDPIAESLRYHGDDFLASSCSAMPVARQVERDRQQSLDNPEKPSRAPNRRTESDTTSKSQQAILRLGYRTGLLIADNVTEGWVPGRQIMLRLSEDPEANQAINECLAEIAEDLELDKYMNAGARLAAITLGLALEIKTAQPQSVGLCPTSSHNSVGDLEPCAFDEPGRD